MAGLSTTGSCGHPPAPLRGHGRQDADDAITRFVDVEQMETMLGMGMQEGMALAIGQIDALLSAGAD